MNKIKEKRMKKITKDIVIWGTVNFIINAVVILYAIYPALNESYYGHSFIRVVWAIFVIFNLIMPFKTIKDIMKEYIIKEVK